MVYLLRSILFIGFFITHYAHTQQKLDTQLCAIHTHFEIIIASRNNLRYWEGNINSVLEQNYPREYMHIVYIDDVSNDGTGVVVHNFIQENQLEDVITLIRNTERKYSLANRYEAIHACDDHSVIIILDGDDQLMPGTLAYIDERYQENPELWLTYGQYQIWPTGEIGYCCQIPNQVVFHNKFRQYPHTPSHLRTFRAKLFKLIEKQDLMYLGNDGVYHFFEMTDDKAMMIPMTEMARNGHFKFLSRINYRYNVETDMNDHKVNSKLQVHYDKMIRARKSYEALTTLF